MNRIEELREELHQRKLAFDRKLAAMRLLPREDHDRRLVQWELFLVEVKPLADKLAKAERDAAWWQVRRSMEMGRRVRRTRAGAVAQ